MNRRTFFGLMAAAPVALAAAPAVAERVIASLTVTQPAKIVPGGISIRYIRDWNDGNQPLSLKDFEERYLRPYFKAQIDACDSIFVRGYYCDPTTVQVVD